ncbi:MAG: GntR family transcriptional regulator [Acetobacteraceae bacterium]|nr:GntR family transcriptional regulator [Acetobacteraceae bacterium]
MNDPPGTLTEEAYRRLEEMIVTLELPPGQAVSEAILGRMLGIGTTPIREALQRLAREHLVRVLPRRGVVVTAVELDTLLQVLETRRELDRLVARAAARRATPTEREAIRRIGTRMLEAVRPETLREFMRLDGELNDALAAAARNAVLAATTGTLQAVSRRFWFHHHRGAEQMAETARLHAALAGAVADGDEGAAAAASDSLVAHLVRFAQGTAPVLEPLAAGS